MIIAIHLEQVSKRYGQAAAVSGLDLTVPSGEVLGFLGPNGAGKTTTIRLLMGFLRPTAGRVRLLGYDMNDPVQAQQVRRQIGFVPDVAGLDPTATGEQLLDDLAALQGQPALERAHIVESLELRQADLRRPIARLSRGTRQKINLVQGLQHRPDLIVLDEPTEALDPLAKRALFDLLEAAKARGATIFFSSHILSEVEELCDRVALIRGGRLVAVEEIATLRAQLARRVTLTLATADAAVSEQLATLPTVTNLAENGKIYQFSIAEMLPLLTMLPTLPVSDLLIEPATLEELFLQYYSK